MSIQPYLSLPLLASCAMAIALGGTQTSEEKKGSNPPAAASNERKSKIEALTIKQKAAGKEPAGSSKGESKSTADSTRGPIGVNEPGVNKAAKPITVNEEGLELMQSKDKNRSVDPSKQQAGPEGKPGKGEAQPAKK
jgi:hypothetical protein